MKNKTRKIVLITLAILLVVLIQAVGITYAKYFASDKGVGSAEIAKWSFKLDKEGNEMKTVNLADTFDYDTLVDGKIAPGTSGVFAINLDATGSEVGIEYEISFANEKNKPNNVSYYFLGKTYNSLSELKINGKIPYDDENKTRELLVSWMWKYETGETDSEILANDKLDTQDANQINEYTFDIIATGSQTI